ncbi:MAG TPA: prolyl oligopeptidase family serine peptidase [Candidatus Hydrogenedentes bacterium]|jgi:predicted esterase|nr:prolyl oligopeptidase family serine peptidase [Candidatus Hydrogenedentota bacterium]
MHAHHLARVPLLLSLAFCVSAAELTFEDVAFTARCDGSEQRYVLGLPATQETGQPRDALIALHGHGSDRWQFVREERGECAAPRHIAQERGMIFISPDYRAKTSWMGPKAEADLLQIMEEVREKYDVARFFICGGSMGASSALTFAALHPDLFAGVAAMNGTANHLEYENYQDAIQESFGGTKAEIPEEYKKRSAEYWPERFTMPLAMSLSGQDKAVPPESSLRLADVLQKMDRKVLVIFREEQGHFSTYEDTRALVEYILAQADAIASEP